MSRRTINACLCGEAEVVLSLPKTAVKLQDLFPGIATDSLGLINILLPPPGHLDVRFAPANRALPGCRGSWITTLNEQAAQGNNQG
jgi:hypothetical protein